jgi:DNA-binding NarL/FixJ family response regulator
MAQLRILLADSQPKVRFALRVLLENQTGLEVVGEIDDTGDLLAKTEAVSPDLVLLHWRMNGFVAADVLPELRAVCPGLHVIVLSARPEARAAALAAGADAFVSKVDPPERLLAAIRSIR